MSDIVLGAIVGQLVGLGVAVIVYYWVISFVDRQEPHDTDCNECETEREWARHD